MAIREFAGAAKATTLSGTVSAAATALNVIDGSGYPTGATGPFVVTLDAGLSSEEKVLVASRTGNTLTVATSGRGYDGTTAADHANAATVQHTISAVDLREANAHVNDTSGDPHPQYLTPAEGAVLYLGAGAKAADSDLLDGLDSTAFLRTTGKAADSDLLDGLDSLAFVPRSIVDAAGDLIVGSGVDTVARLALGAAGTVLTSQGGTAAWVAGGGVQIAVGTYTGNGTASQSVALAFTPKFVIVTTTALFSVSNIGSNAIGFTHTASSGAASDNPNLRPTLGTNAFTASGSAAGQLNVNTTVYQYLAIG